MNRQGLDRLTIHHSSNPRSATLVIPKACIGDNAQAALGVEDILADRALGLAIGCPLDAAHTAGT